MLPQHTHTHTLSCRPRPSTHSPTHPHPCPRSWPPPLSTPRPARPAGPAETETGSRGSPHPLGAGMQGFRGAGAPPADQCGTGRSLGPNLGPWPDRSPVCPWTTISWPSGAPRAKSEEAGAQEQMKGKESAWEPQEHKHAGEEPPGQRQMGCREPRSGLGLGDGLGRAGEGRVRYDSQISRTGWIVRPRLEPLARTGPGGQLRTCLEHVGFEGPAGGGPKLRRVRRGRGRGREAGLPSQHCAPLASDPSLGRVYSQNGFGVDKLPLRTHPALCLSLSRP